MFYFVVHLSFKVGGATLNINNDCFSIGHNHFPVYSKCSVIYAHVHVYHNYAIVLCINREKNLVYDLQVSPGQ